MKTINTILEYNLTSEEIAYLEEAQIINWCGGKWWVNFDKILKDNLEIIPWFDKDKAENLYLDIKLICLEHDLQFWLWLWFLKSNYKFAKKIYKLLHWCPLKYRLSIALICLALLNRFWKEFYFVKK
jgi:hypothetical protein